MTLTGSLGRSLAAVLTAGSLLLAGCAGDDLAEDGSSDDGSSASGGGPVSIAGQAFQIGRAHV